MARPARGPARTAVEVGVGLGLVGAAGYLFVALVGHVFAGAAGAAQASALSTLYLLVNVLGPGLFTAVEQETSRSVSAARAAGRAIGPPARRAALLAAGLLATMTVALLALWRPLLARVLDDRPGLLLALVVAGAGAAVAYWVRGLLAAQQRFSGYALTLLLEGGVRLLGSVALVLLAVRAPTAYALVFAAGAGVAGLALLPSCRTPPGRAEPGQLDGMLPSLLLLVTATLLSQAVANLAPVVVTYRLPDELLRASSFTATFVLARVPLFLFAPVQALLLPSLTRAATTGRTADLRRRVRLVLLAVLGVGVPGVLLVVLVGPWAVATLFNADQPPGRPTLALLGAATLLMMCCQVLQPALVALGRQRTVVTAWVSGAVVFGVLLVAPVDPVDAALVAQLAGAGAVVAVMGVVLARAVGRRDAVLPG